MQRFPSAAHLCKWAGICPGNHESAGKQYSGKTPPSNRWLRGKKSADGECCCAVAKPPPLQPSTVAVAHRLLIAVYHMLRQHQPYQDYRTTNTGHPTPEQLLKKLQQQVERLGYQVQLIPISTTRPLR